eukprot:TRINITY_DN62948_c0_g1_i1.p1 TRINITY_DN62948_c0_g1~~TRINITY_DN62948_c0_g1_i1.p1  ORF type:complete len:422 (+),score=55.00 TRINITY_DN62948_c0_g1_i1:101-1366(+)
MIFRAMAATFTAFAAGVSAVADVAPNIGSGSLRKADCGGNGYLLMRLCESWHARVSSGVLRRAAVEHLGDRAVTRRLDGFFGFGAQLTPHRGQKRALNRTSLNSTRLPFNADVFHFGKVQREEVLFCFNPIREESCQHTAAKNTCHMPGYLSALPPDADACGPSSKEPAVVVVNMNPVCDGHALIVPDITEGHAQVLTEKALVLGLAFSFRSSPNVWLSFNSIGAGASVNHLHWQTFSAELVPGGRFPFDVHIEDDTFLVEAALRRGPISLKVTNTWPVPAWVFTWEDRSTMTIDTGLVEHRLAEFVYAFISQLQNIDMAHNVLICCGGTRVIVFPRKILNQQGTDVTLLQVAGHELLGWWIVTRTADFEALNESLSVEILRDAALDVASTKQVAESLRTAGWRLADDLSTAGVETRSVTA